ncbi:FxSxx-COOH system tetratricopeptide repeat protein [Actinospica robiniae]|uniref:FxSxx-COOH system tetratricopeptide repeat protein n=1 Tax=Actinospica robiniae TaxID=304901 RepID=UPI0003F8D5DC|nr:FxSxx-COOH system tetratricopeptide repeat protein [Actinospica robiniae]
MTSFDSELFSRHVVQIFDLDDGMPLGTGFFVGAGWLLTCAHVVDAREHVGIVAHRSLGGAGDLRAHVEARSAAPGWQRNWPFPDLALLQLDQPFTHPCVLLSDQLPDERRPVYAWGHTREEFEQAGGPRGSQATFTFEGLQQGFLKLKAGQAQPGLSGAPLVCPSRKAVVGVVGWSRDLESDLGALATPISALLNEELCGDARLAQFGAHLFANSREAVGRTLGTWRRLFPIDAAENPLRRMDAQFKKEARSSPSDLLHTDYGVVPFLFRDDELRRMRDWCRASAAMSVAVVTGDGGAGKTRFARELCREMAREGWTSGLWPDEQGSDAPHRIGELIRLQQPRLIVVDYVERMPQDRLRADLDEMHAHATELAPIRVLLLHRTSDASGDGRSDLLISLNRNASGQVRNVLSGAEIVDAATTALTGSQRQQLYQSAMESFTAAWYQDQETRRLPDLGAVPETLGLEGDQFSLPLMILFEAMDNALRPSGSDERPGVERILEHEQSYWNATAPAGLEPDARLRCVALATLVGARTEEEARRLLGVALEQHPDSAFVGRALAWLGQLYPRPHVLNPLRPDRLGEYLIVTVLTSASSTASAETAAADLLCDLLALPSDQQVATCLDTLVRILPNERRFTASVCSALLTSHARLLRRAALQAQEPAAEAASISRISHGLIRLMAGEPGARLARENAREPDDHALPGTFTQLGDEAAALDLYDEAERLYRCALQFHAVTPRRQGARSSMAASATQVKLAELAQRRARLDVAEVCYQEAADAAMRAFERDTQDPAALDALIEVYHALESVQRQLGKPRLAQETVERAVSVRAAFGIGAVSDPSIPPVLEPWRTETPQPLTGRLWTGQSSDTQQGRVGQVVTFHSFQGGTGQTMAMANLAWILAANGKRVLIVDFELESPGLHRYFPPSLLDPQAFAALRGVVDMVREFEDVAAETPDENRGRNWYRRFARVRDYALAIRWPFPGDGALHYMSSGLQNHSYTNAVATLDWERFYERLGGGELFDAFRADMIQNYDYALIDSRKGLSDIADICTLHLPDVVVESFTLNRRGLEGALQFAGAVSRWTNHPIRLLAVPMRVDGGESGRADALRAAARSRFAQLDLDELAETQYWSRVEIPYVPFYNYEEILAPFVVAADDRTSLLSSYVRLAEVLTKGEVAGFPEMPEALRRAMFAEAVRLQPSRPEQLVIAYAAADRLWAEWLEALYLQADFNAQIYALFGDPSALPTIERHARIVALMSEATARDAEAMAQLRDWAGTGRLSVAALAELPAESRLAVPTAELQGETDPVATTRILLDLAEVSDAGIARVRPPASRRFPSARPAIWNVGTRNALFTGRDALMQALRHRLVGDSMTVVLPAPLHGRGGVGTTELACEYAHRFSADYDLIWWIDAETTEFIDESMAEAARRMRLPGVGESCTEDAAALRDALRRGEGGRWLLIYDNAVDPSRLEPFLTAGTSGHVLIISRDPAWAERAVPLYIDAFTEPESLEYLSRIALGLEHQDAVRSADLAGHLPLALESVAAALALSGQTASQYLDLLEAAAAGDGLVSLAATWSAVMEGLERRQPSGARLLELCAFMNPDAISLSGLICSAAMLEALREHDPSLVDLEMLGAVVAELVRFSLLQQDQATGDLRMHRLVQAIIRDRMSSDRVEEARHVVHRMLASARPEPSDGGPDDPDNWPYYARLWPHLAPSDAVDCDEIAVRQLLIERVHYLWIRGDYRNALQTGCGLEERWLRRIDEFGGRRTAAGAALYRQWLVLRSLHASVLRSEGSFHEAYEIDLEVIAEQERLNTEEHPDALAGRRSLGSDLRGLNRFKEALENDTESYARHRRVYSEDDPRLLGAASDLAVDYRLLGDCYKAADLDQSTCTRMASVLRPMHPRTRYAVQNLARDLRDAGQYVQSVDLLRRSLGHYRHELGEYSPEALRTAISLAASLLKAGELNEALTLARDTFTCYRTKIVAPISDLQSAALVYAVARSASGRDEAALRLSEAVLEVYEQQLGPQHPYTLCCLNDISAYLRKLDYLDEALRTSRRAHSGFHTLLGSEHPYTLVAAANLAVILADTGEHARAAELGHDAARKLAEVLRPEHPDVLAIESNLSISLQSLGSEAEALQLRARVVEEMETVLGPTHHRTNAARAGERLDWSLEPQPI